MVYGFGTREYLATGYKAELVSGYSWGEFNDEMYLGMSYQTGGFRGMGYIMGGFTLGSYIDLKSGMWRHSAVDVDLKWFSNLFLFRRSRIRQFLAFNYTQGWNRGEGSDEMIRFTHDNGLQALKEYVTGTNRMILNTETVVFTPYQPLGFRIAVFGFADFGLIGYSPNIFKTIFSPRSEWVYGSATSGSYSTRCRSAWESPSANAGWSRANISACRTPRASNSTATAPPALRS